jgi:hypothetical protein
MDVLIVESLGGFGEGCVAWNGEVVRGSEIGA